MKVAVGTLSLLLAIAVAFFGFVISQGERDILRSFLTTAGVLAAVAVASFGWSAVEWRQRARLRTASGGSAAPAPDPGAASTVLLVVGIVVGFVGLPMFFDVRDRLTGSGAYESSYGGGIRSSDYPVAEWPWLFAVGLAATVSALVWKVRLRRRRL